MFKILNHRHVLSFVFGFISFYAISSVMKYSVVNKHEHKIFSNIHQHSDGQMKQIGDDDHSAELDKQKLTWSDQHSDSHHDEDIVAKILYKKVRIFCWIMTISKAHENKAKHVKATWAKRCNNYIFISDKNDPSLPSININVTMGRNHLWQKTKNAFKYIYKHHLKDYDYFLKADDDTFVIMENLRHMVKSYDSNDPFYMGRRFKPYVKQGYMSGGGGYLLSRGALHNLIDKGIDISPLCPAGEGGAEDVNIGVCLEAAGVRVQDSLDSEKRERFHPLVPVDMLLEDHMKNIPWMFSYNYYKLKFGTDCCSDDSVTFHYVSPPDMYMMEFLIYHLRPYGIVRDYHEIKDIISKMDKRKSFLKNVTMDA